MQFLRPSASERDPSGLNPDPTTRASGPSDDSADAERLTAAVRAHVAELLGEEDPEFVQDLVDAFSGSAHDLVASAETARAGGDLDAIGGVAHQLKGSASNVGLTDLEEAWHRVESGARAGDPTALGLPLAAAIAETERAARLLAA